MEDDLRQIIVVNKSLGMTPGKVASQVGHAAVGAFVLAPREIGEEWLQSMTKVVLKVFSEVELYHLRDLAKQMQLPHYLVIDEGRTEIAPHSVTCLGIGPARRSTLNKIIGDLKLY